MNIINKITLRSLMKNKTRTIVTIIGVILSAAMITAVATFISSFQNYLVNLTLADTGDWHAKVYDSTRKELEYLEKNDDISVVIAVKNIGYAPLAQSLREDKPYIFILGVNDTSLAHLPVYLKQGRLPENDNEIVLSSGLTSNGGLDYKVGDSITLQTGHRKSEKGEVLWQNDSLLFDEKGNLTEKFEVTQTKIYKIVGICEYPLEGYYSPGYTAITKYNNEINPDEAIEIYLKMKKPSKIYEFFEKMEQEKIIQPGQYKYNRDLLMYMGVSSDEKFNTVLYSLAGIIIVLIMIGSIALIYNSFSISVSERTRQCGLLSGVGATSKQLKKSVLFESYVIAVIGIPLGVLSGITGIGVTLHFIKNLFADLISTSVPVPLKLVISFPSVIIAVFVSFVTVLISAYIPARRAGKTSALDAIRQTQDIKLSSRQVRTLGITRKVFGIEGDIALKNIKRNKKRYRSTVVSLFISVVLFISASAYSLYLKFGTESVFDNYNYDFSYVIRWNMKSEENTAYNKLFSAYRRINNLEGIKDGSIVKVLNLMTHFSKSQVDDSLYKTLIETGLIKEGENIEVSVDFYIVDSETFEKYALNTGLDPNEYNNPESPAGIIVDRQKYYDFNDKKHHDTTILKNRKNLSMTLGTYPDKNDDFSITLKINHFAEEVPMGVRNYGNPLNVIVIINDKISEKLLENYSGDCSLWICFSAENPAEIGTDIKKILEEEKLDSSSLHDVYSAIRNNRNIITIMSVFTYGFIVLISLITIANVFNTITTNIHLRRREFAMLKSVGMTDKSFNKMLNYECIFYGIKALLYGLPVSLVITVLIYKGLSAGVKTSFKVPWNSILISILSIFVVVFVCMIYSMKKIKKENILDALKNENL